jgi:hypothetical protein
MEKVLVEHWDVKMVQMLVDHWVALKAVKTEVSMVAMSVAK